MVDSNPTMSSMARDLIAKNRKNRGATLDLGNCGLSKIPTGISELTWLRSLSLSPIWFEYEGAFREGRMCTNSGESNTDVYDIGALSSLTGLEALGLRDTGVADIHPLAVLGALQYLDLAGSEVTDISALASLVQLRFVDLSNTGVRDLTPLSSLPALEFLNISATEVNDLRPLASLPSLRIIDASQT